MFKGIDWKTFHFPLPSATPEPEPVKNTHKTCNKCCRELSKELDAYWGKDPWEAEFCIKCRGK